MTVSVRNEAVPNLPFFYPKSPLPPGSALKITSSTPKLFTPLQIRSQTLHNRVVVAPMCNYSCAPDGPEVGALTSYHIATLGQYAMKGAALVFVECTAVTPEGRITPNDVGLWTDEQQAALGKVVDHIHAAGARVGVQLGHSGRKGSTVAPWLAEAKKLPSIVADEAAGGWPEDVLAPSAIAWSKEGYAQPKELTKAQIQAIVQAFADSAKRAVAAGVDVIEIHGAHGYLVSSFNSPLSNQRTDEYGGSFENRTRFPLEVTRAVRQVIPADMPLFYRISSTEWMDGTEDAARLGSWTVEDSIRFAKLLPAHGVDLLDVSSGGNNEKQRIKPHTTYQIEIAGRIRRALREDGLDMLVGAVGMITGAQQARDIVDLDHDHSGIPGDEPVLSSKVEAEQARDSVEGQKAAADLVLVGRQFMREPEWVLRVAWKLGVDVQWPVQYHKSRFLE